MSIEESRRQLSAAREQYEARVREILEAGSEAPREARTQSGLPLKLLYTPLDVEGTDYRRDLGFPGAYPFTRGVFSAGYHAREWTRRQVVGLGTAEETNRRLERLFTEGQTGFSVCGMGYQSYDSDDERSLGHLGRGGVWIDTLADMETLLCGIDMEAISLNQIGASIPVFAMLLAVAQRRGIPWERLRGTIQNWAVPGGEGPELRGNGSIDIIEFCTKHMPRWNHSSISVRNLRDSGATAPQEMAFGLYQGAFTVRAAMARGLDVDAFAPRISFFLSAESDFLEEVAKFRAMRRMWARLMRERFRARNPRSWAMRFHVQTSALSLTAEQPLNNLVRSTLHALAAVLGGAHSMSVNSFDEVLAIPTELSATLSLRTQEIILHESGVAKVIDPLGGSYCVEALTNQLEAEALKLLETLEAMDPVAAFQWMDAETEEEAARRQRAFEADQRVVVGLNRFRVEDEAWLPELPLFEYDPGWREKQIARLQRVRAERDPVLAGAARKRLAEAYRAKANIIPPMVEAVKAHLSIGEIARVREEVLGEPPFTGAMYFWR
ncbi:MAG: methylmalonyl-CoA mutase [Candidatus Rokubacteria bacterium]|nr:methylmalonyl-CoA mutase [Candidatus Rokubacteria bacterium]